MKGKIMKKIDIVKGIATFIVGAGTTKIVNGIILSNTEPKNVYDKVAIVSAGVVIGTMAADATSDYTDAKIDEIVALWNNRHSDTHDTIEGELATPTD